MKLLKIEFRNIGPYGNKLQTLEFDNQGKLVLLQGKSGDGKSTLLNLPSLLFYGKVTKRSKKEICNRVNKNGFIRGIVVSEGHEYIIERKFSPNGIKVFKDGEDLDKIGVKDAQNYIDENIVQMPQEIFSNIVSLSMSKFKSFLNMTAEDRRQIIDRVFNLEMINIIFNIIKKDVRDTGLAINNDNTQICTLTETIRQANAELVRLNEINNAQNNEEIEKNNKVIETENANIAQYTQKYKECDELYKTYNTQLQEHTSNLQKISMTVSVLQQKLNLYNQGQCPTCGASFKGEEFDKVRVELETKINQTQELYQKESESQKAIYEYLQQLYSAMQKINSSISASQNQINIANINNHNLNEALKQNVEYKSIQNIIDNNMKSLEVAKKQLELDAAKKDKLDILSSLYSVDGVKKIILKNYLPHLNNEINKSLKFMDFPYKLTFDEQFDGKLYFLNQEIGVDTISDGEHKRVDLAVLCSVFKLLKRKYPTINLFTLDEVLSSLDPLTASVILRFLKEFANEMELNIYVVSHVDMEESLFDESIKVFKDMGFSDIQFNKKLD